MLTATSLVWHCCKSHSRADFPAGFPLKFVCCSNMTMILELWFSHFLSSFNQNSQFWSLDYLFQCIIRKIKISDDYSNPSGKRRLFLTASKTCWILKKGFSSFSIYYFFSVRHFIVFHCVCLAYWALASWWYHWSGFYIGRILDAIIGCC